MWTAPAYFAAFVVGHGSVLYPPTRNAIDSTIAPWKGATIGPNNDKYVSVPSPLLSPPFLLFWFTSPSADSARPH